MPKILPMSEKMYTLVKFLPVVLLIIGTPYVFAAEDSDTEFCTEYQAGNINVNVKMNADGSVDYSLCYDKASCSATNDESNVIHVCGNDIKKYGAIKYFIATRDETPVADLEAGKSGWQFGGIDLSNPFSPKLSLEKINGLTPGSYRLAMEFCDIKGANCNENNPTYINFRIVGNLDIMTETSTYTVNAGDEESPFYTSGTKWDFIDEANEDSRVPVYVSAFAGNGIDLLCAIGQKYTLDLDQGLIAYTSETGKTQITFPKTIGESGIDTIWISHDSEEAISGNSVKKNVSLKSQISIKFKADSPERLYTVATASNMKSIVLGRKIYITGIATPNKIILLHII